jgi:hypothetical protein
MRGTESKRRLGTMSYDAIDTINSEYDSRLCRQIRNNCRIYPKTAGIIRMQIFWIFHRVCGFLEESEMNGKKQTNIELPILLSSTNPE